MTNEPWDPFPQPDSAFYRSPASGLFLPTDDTEGHGKPTPDETPSVMEHFHVRVSWSDLYGPAPTYDDVVARLRPYGLEMVLATLAAISRRISMLGADGVLKSQADIITLSSTTRHGSTATSRIGARASQIPISVLRPSSRCSTNFRL